MVQSALKLLEVEEFDEYAEAIEKLAGRTEFNVQTAIEERAIILLPELYDIAVDNVIESVAGRSAMYSLTMGLQGCFFEAQMQEAE